MHVTLVGGYDDRVPSSGGVRPYVDSVARYLEGAGIPHLEVVSSGKLEFGIHRLAFPVRKPRSTLNFIGSLSANLRRLPIPWDTIVHVQRPDLMLPFLLGATGKARVCTIHGNPLEGIRERAGPGIFAGYALLEAHVLRRTDLVIFVDSVNASAYLQRYPWLEGRIEVIPNAVDTNVFRTADRGAAKAKWGFEGTVFLYAGRLQPEKRVIEIVRAFRELRGHDVSLAVAGVGRDAPAIAEEARAADVRMLGPVAREQMPSLMNASDALLLYSTREGMPTVVLEALASGLPVITTPVGAVPDVVKEGKSGFLVTSRAGLTEAMERIRNGELRPSDAISRMVRQYSWDLVGPSLLGAYSKAAQAAD